MNRRMRSLAAHFALIALLFAQLALPAQGCPRVAEMNAMTHAMAADETASVDAMPCERHCVESVKPFDAVKPGVAAPAVAIAMPLRVASPVAIPHAVVRNAAPDTTGPAPPFLRSTVLRI